jgi:hypothetical protein
MGTKSLRLADIRRHGGFPETHDLQVERQSASRASDERPALRAMTSQRRLEELRAESRYRRERRDLYRAKVYGSRATSRFRHQAMRSLSPTKCPPAPRGNQ